MLTGIRTEPLSFCALGPLHGKLVRVDVEETGCSWPKELEEESVDAAGF
jgi:hypothetical protein